MRDFPGGTVVKNLPASAGDRGSSPGPGRSHMPWSNKACAPQLLTLRSRACEPQLLSPRASTTEARVPRAHAPQQEKPPQWETHTPQWRVDPARRNQRKPVHSNEDPTQPKTKKKTLCERLSRLINFPVRQDGVVEKRDLLHIICSLLYLEFGLSDL